jgi:uncharacterized membrane protein
MEIIFYIAIVLFVLFGPWVLALRVHIRRKRERLEDQQRWADLTGRVHALEREIWDLRSRTLAPAAEVLHKEAVAEAHAPSPEAATTPTAPEPTPAQKAAEAWVTRKPAEAAPAAFPASGAPVSVAPPTSAQPRVPLAAPPAPQPASSPAPTFAVAEPGPSLFDRFRSALDIEEMLGTDWLNKLGIALLVLGVAFFLAYQLKTMGPVGKILVGLVTAAVMLSAGVWFEHRDRYRILARAGIGGGWALLFFTTYAMYHVPAAQVLSSQPADLVAMLAVAAAMVAHTLRYRSQVVTGLAFLLAFLTVTISHSNGCWPPRWSSSSDACSGSSWKSSAFWLAT